MVMVIQSNGSVGIGTLSPVTTVVTITHIQSLRLQEIREAIMRIQTNMTIISDTCPDIGLSLHMCHKIDRICNFTQDCASDKPSSQYKNHLRAHEYQTLCLCMPYVLEGLLKVEMQKLSSMIQNDKSRQAQQIKKTMS